MTEVPDEIVWEAVLEADRRLFKRGLALRERSWDVGRVSWEILVEHGIAPREKPAPDEFTQEAVSRLKSIYGERAFSGGFGTGLTDFRGVGYLFDIPLAYGTIKLNPFEFVDLSDAQKHTIDQDEVLLPRFLGAFEAAFQINTRNSGDHLRGDPEKAKLSRECIRNYRSACFIAARTKDHGDAFQSMCLALELGMKQLLLSNGFTIEQLRSKPFGHNLTNLGSEAVRHVRAEHADEMVGILARSRNLVDNRYGDDPISSTDALKFCLDAQFILREISIAEHGPCISFET